MTKKEGLRDVLLSIRATGLLVANSRKRWFLRSYGSLGTEYGGADAWCCDGWIRNAISGRAARLWLQDDFGLWWKADDQEHEGILFTCCSTTGLEWDRARETNSMQAGATYLMDTVHRCEQLRPTHRPFYRTIGDAARQMSKIAKKLKEAGDAAQQLLPPGSEAA